MTRPNLLQLATAVLLLGSCGGDDSPTAPAPPQTEARTVSGTARASGANSCSGDSHDFLAAEGAISITLLQTTGGVGMGVQVCAGGVDNNNCTINLRPIVVGQMVSGARIGAASQNLKFNTANCGGGGPAPAMPIEYTATLTFLRQ